ncbi:hypothetical protein AVEN_81319-1 [Araneus ventricosus]|uniref:Uncharacterized protein n=1 Tax=Araneus ventricosus TaxID=182803 RepID=A0A4Y2B6N9_ARAVE|nr:hypothetical protein AVEN_81319-1 [Araneus ventricosus]
MIPHASVLCDVCPPPTADIDLRPGVLSQVRSPLCSPSSDKLLLTNIWFCELQVSSFIYLLHRRGVTLSNRYLLSKQVYSPAEWTFSDTCSRSSLTPLRATAFLYRTFVCGVVFSTTYCLECGNLGHNSEPFSPPDVNCEDKDVSRENGMHKRLCCNINFGPGPGDDEMKSRQPNWLIVFHGGPNWKY